MFYYRMLMFIQRTTGGELLEQHRAINTALQTRDAEASRNSVIAHLDYVETALTNFKKSTQNEAIAKQRYEHELSR